MALVQNTSDKDFKVVYQGVEYIVSIGEPIEIPDVAAKLYFAYGNDSPSPDTIKWCCQRMRGANPGWGNVPDKEIWDKVIRKVIFGKEVLKKNRR